jgi:hypothetical protein
MIKLREGQQVILDDGGIVYSKDGDYIIEGINLKESPAIYKIPYAKDLTYLLTKMLSSKFIESPKKLKSILFNAVSAALPLTSISNKDEYEREFK